MIRNTLNMKNINRFVIVLFVAVFLSSCGKLGSKNDLIGTWQVTTMEGIFDGYVVHSETSSDIANTEEGESFSRIEFTDALVIDSGGISLPYSFDNDVITVSAFIRTMKWKVNKLTSSELSFDIPIEEDDLDSYNLLDRDFIISDNNSDRADIIEQLAIKYKGKSILWGETKTFTYSSNRDMVFYYIDSDGKRVQCELNNAEMSDYSFVQNYLAGQINSDDWFFISNVRFGFKKVK